MNKKQNIDAVNYIEGDVSGGYIAGRDINISTDPIKPKLEELANICEHRANAIQRDLQQYYEYIDVQKWLNEFFSLHTRHVEALRSGRIIEAHEILIEIHKISYQLECMEVSVRNSKIHGAVDYAMLPNAGKRGPMISGYVTGDIMRDPKSYSETVEEMSYGFNLPTLPSEKEVMYLYNELFLKEYNAGQEKSIDEPIFDKLQQPIYVDMQKNQQDTQRFCWRDHMMNWIKELIKSSIKIGIKQPKQNITKQYWKGSNIPLVPLSSGEGMIPDFCTLCGEPCIIDEPHTHTDLHRCRNGHEWWATS